MTLPVEHDFAWFIKASAQRTRYRLVAVVKKKKTVMVRGAGSREEEGRSVAFVYGEDGAWWRCEGMDVRRVKGGEWRDGGGDGDVEMAFYEQLE